MGQGNSWCHSQLLFRCIYPTPLLQTMQESKCMSLPFWEGTRLEAVQGIINSLSRIMEGCQGHLCSLAMTFIAFKKAFDSINREPMHAVLHHYRIPYPVFKAIGFFGFFFLPQLTRMWAHNYYGWQFSCTTSTSVSLDVWSEDLAIFLFIILVDFHAQGCHGCRLQSGTHTLCSRQKPAVYLTDLDFVDIALLKILHAQICSGPAYPLRKTCTPIEH